MARNCHNERKKSKYELGISLQIINPINQKNGKKLAPVKQLFRSKGEIKSTEVLKIVRVMECSCWASGVDPSLIAIELGNDTRALFRSKDIVTPVVMCSQNLQAINFLYTPDKSEKPTNSTKSEKLVKSAISEEPMNSTN